MEDLAQALIDNLLVPGFAAGFLTGGVLMYFSISKGFVMTPLLSKLKVEVAELRGQIDRLQSALTDLEKQSETFLQWRDEQAQEALGRSKL